MFDWIHKLPSRALERIKKLPSRAFEWINTLPSHTEFLRWFKSLRLSRGSEPSRGSQSSRTRHTWFRMTIIFGIWFGSGYGIAYATIMRSSAYYLLVFIPIAITFEYAMHMPSHHKPQKHRLPRLTLLVFIIIGSLLAAAGYFRNPRQRRIFIILYVVGMVVLLFYGWMASRMSKSLNGIAETADSESDAIIWLLKLDTSQNLDLFKEASRILRGSSFEYYKPKILESLMPLLSSLIVSHRPEMELEGLEPYVSFLAYLADFNDQKGSWSLLWEDAMSHPKLKSSLRLKLEELVEHQTLGRDASKVLCLFGLGDRGDTSSMMTSVESADSCEKMKHQSRRKGGYYSVDVC